MHKGRLEAFSDGVFAIIITIMVLELKTPRDPSPSALQPLLPLFLSYVLSFVYVGIYWCNHHHLFQIVRKIDGRVLWANLHLLFWLSLTPFTTGWLGATNFGMWPTLAYGVALLLSACSFTILVNTLLAQHDENSAFAHAVSHNRKRNVSLALYAVALPLAWVDPRLSCGLFAVVALIWVIPDRRIEVLHAEESARS